MGELFNKLGNIGRRALKVIKNVFKKALISTAPIWGTILLILVILAALTYENTIQEGTEQEGSWKSTPYVANQFDANIEIAEDGTITTDVTPQELWDEMLKRGNEIKSYLNNSKEFAKLLHAEQITNFPDTRSDPSEEINWNDIIKPKSNRIQGIIKFKRETGGADPIDLVYVDDGTFMDWLEGYNLTGDETLKQNLLTHFTIGSNIVQTQSSNNNQDISLNYQEGDVWTDISEAIVRSALSTDSRGPGLCQSWVYHVYVNAGLPDVGFGTAYLAFKANCLSTDRNNIPIGAAVYATGSGSAGHVGIYVGDINGDGQGDVMDNIESGGVGIVRTISLSDWIAEAERQGNTNCGGDTVTPGFLGWGWQSGSPSRFLTEEEIEKIDITSEATTPVEGETGSVGTASKSEYYVLVATWSETTENSSTTVDGVQTASNPSSYGSMTTQKINYQDYISKYTMPFEYLWSLIVTGRDNSLALDLADLVLDSEIEITIHDVLTTTTDRTTTVRTYSEFNEVTQENESHTRTTVTETITKNNTLNIGLTKADVWIVDYEQEYIYSEPTVISENTTHSRTSTYYNLVTADKYVAQPASPNPKIEKGKDQHNFITIFLDGDNYNARNSILSAPDWLFTILERNDSTKEMVDLTKYLLHVATGNNYGVTDYDFSVFEPGDFTSINTGGSADDLLLEYIGMWESGSSGPPKNADGTKYIVISDGYGHPTVGYGIDIYNSGYLQVFLDAGYSVEIGAEIDVEFVDNIKLQILDKNKAAVNALGLDLTGYQFNALVSFCYNLGNVNGFKGLYNTYWDQERDDKFEEKDSTADFNHNLYTQYFSQYVNVNGKFSEGLLNRRKSEWTLFQTGYYDVLNKWHPDGGDLSGDSQIEDGYFAYPCPGHTWSTYSGHEGIDISWPGCEGQPVYAAQAGMVSLVQTGHVNNQGSSGMASYGNCVFIQHENGWESRYAHMTSVVVSRGEQVEQGQLLGYIGNTGNSYGAHLHISLYDPSGNEGSGSRNWAEIAWPQYRE